MLLQVGDPLFGRGKFSNSDTY
uniref:Uncharacterized protein n=1 Tax=Rhizophora mucronata TaxID=61149 RepID=A0A2P2QS76_RHIMU